ncbi:MAG: hypothetical protein NWF06_11225 [Candidatus Bathyarchaeota archaeon]|nr:hypothetical protein [Candidatus Bathyarchaeum sp.]
MKKFKLPIMVLAVLSLTFVALSSFTTFEVKADTQILFQDNFDSYDTGTFPSTGGWELWYSGIGKEYQVVVADTSNSSAKSLQLWGRDGWVAYASAPLATASPIVGFNVSVKVSELGTGTHVTTQVGFGQNLPPSRVTTYCPIYVMHNGSIAISNYGCVMVIGPEEWHKITVVVNRNTETFSCWIDDVLYGEDFGATTNRDVLLGDETTWDLEAFSVCQNYHNIKVYFDDVTVFSSFNADPKLELEPSSGLAATTLVGSGFASNSEISVKWNGVNIHTVPNPLVSDRYGNFTAIISVLNQTVPGSYVVHAVDGYGYSAEATFEVVSVVPPVSEEPNQTSVTQNSETAAASVVPSVFQPLDSLLFIVPAVFALAAFYKHKKRSSTLRECKT